MIIFPVLHEWHSNIFPKHRVVANNTMCTEMVGINSTVFKHLECWVSLQGFSQQNLLYSYLLPNFIKFKVINV